MPSSPPLIKPLLQGVQTWRGLHNALQRCRMGQSQWTAGTERRNRRGKRHLRLSLFHLQPDSYFLKLSSRWRLYDYSFPLRLPLFILSFTHFPHVYTYSWFFSLFFFFFSPSVEDSECAFEGSVKNSCSQSPVLNKGISKNRSSERRHLAMCAPILQRNQR